MDPKISPEDVKSLLDKGLISQETHDKMLGIQPEQYTQGQNSNNINDILPNIPKNAPILASSLVSNPISDAIGIVKDGVGAVNDGAVANTNTQSNQINTQSGATPETFQDTLNERKTLTPYTQEAQKGIQDIATQEKKLASPVGSEIKNSGLDILNSANTDLETSRNDRDKAVQQSSKALIQAESSLKDAASKALIDPNQYLSNLGVDGKILTGVGLVLSGIGSGLAGQPNLANEMLQKNIQRNIEAQKQNYVNAVSQSKEYQNIAAGAKDRAALANAAYQAAGIQVTTGVITALQGLQTQLSGATAQGKSAVLLNQSQQQLFTFKQQFDEAFKSAAQSGDVKLMNMYKGLADKVDELLNSKASPNSIQTPSTNNREQIQPTKPVEPPAPEAPAKETFLNKVSGAGKDKISVYGASK